MQTIDITAVIPQGHIIATAVALPDAEQPKRRKRTPKSNLAKKQKSNLLRWADEGEFAQDDDAGGVVYTYATSLPLVESMA